MILLPGRVEFRSPSGESGRLGLPSFGEKLKLEREKRKITLEQISVSTKIGTRMLQALEEDNFNQLPGGIFNRGFVRAYSRFLGLDEDQTIADYMQASGDALPASTETAAREDGSREDATRENRENKKIKIRSAAWKLAPTPLLAKYPGACSPGLCWSSLWHCRSGAIAVGST